MSEKSPYHRALADTDAMPLDFTFKKWDSLVDLGHDKPREGRVGKPPHRGPHNRFLTKGLWLNNNNLKALTGIETFVNNVLEFPDQLTWLDLSFNMIKDIDPVILKFQNLTILYFHGNEIESLDAALNLRNLKKIKRLTLHGNPVATIQGYRNIMIHSIPQLHNLDFAPILQTERVVPVPTSLAKKFYKEIIQM